MAVTLPETRQIHNRYFVSLSNYYQTKKARVYTGIVLSFLTIAFFIFFTIRPTLVTIAGLVKEISDKKAVVEKLETKIQALNLAQIEYQQIESKLFLVDEALPVRADVSPLIRQLETLANQDSVTINSLQIQKTTLKENLKNPQSAAKADNDSSGLSSGVGTETGFSLSISGNYQEVKTFFGDLYRFRRIVVIDPFEFLNKTDGNQIDLTIKGKAYYLPQPS